MRVRSLLVGTLSVAVLALSVYAADAIKLEGIKCVMVAKNPAKEDKYVAYKGGKVFFCCANCPKGFEAKVKDDKLVAAKGNQQLIATGQAKQEKCPFSGGPTKDGTEITVNAATIKFCCNECQGKAKKLEGDEQTLALFGDEAYEKAGFKVAKADKE